MHIWEEREVENKEPRAFWVEVALAGERRPLCPCISKTSLSAQDLFVHGEEQRGLLPFSLYFALPLPTRN